jgi:tyrosine-protein phosphatase SIW14
MPEGYQTFIDGSGIKHQIFNMSGTKKAEIPLPMMQSILGLVVDKKNHPILIHCNHGKHRTGCVVGVLRKSNGWDTPSILAEYSKYAEPKIRETDIKYITDFKLADVRQVMSRKLLHQPLGLGQFFFLIMVASLSLGVWALSLKNVMYLPHYPPARKDKS